jgi:uncharacterized protein (TIGR03437 family)
LRSHSVCLALFISFSAWAQNSSLGPVIGSAGYSNPLPLPVAPGQLLTLFVQSTPSGTSGTPSVSAVFWNGSDQPMPVLQVNQSNVACTEIANSACAQSLAVTVQIPFGILTVCNICANPLQAGGSIAVTVNGVKTPYVAVRPFQDQVHFVTACDVLVAGASGAPSFGGFPCAPKIMHSDGTLVSANSPAHSGEELVAYATGLGQTNPPLATGQPAAASSPTGTTFALDFNYHPNALASKPRASSVTGFAPLFTDATKGYIGLYQINFLVPPVPAGLPPCNDPGATLINGNVVQTNLTVSVGSIFSFDGAAICVQPSGAS